MKKKNFNEAQIMDILRNYEGWRKAMDFYCEYGILKATLYNWHDTPQRQEV